MECEQFISCLSKLLTTSPNIEKVVSLAELEFLIHVGNGVEEAKCLRTIVNDDYGAVSYIEPVRDEYNRKGVWNHTIIVNLKDYFNYTQPIELFAKSFIRYSESPPKKLSTLTVKENVSTPTKPIQH